MTSVRIYQPSKSAMQSGLRNTRRWVLEFEPGAPKFHDPLMGWVGSTDTRSQVRLSFATRDEAIAFAERNGLSFRAEQPKKRTIRAKSYAENFTSAPA